MALGSYVRLRDPARAEVAFAVADELQGKGVGTRLLEQLADEAGRVGIESFLAEVLADNRAMLGVLESAGFEVAARVRQRRGRGDARDRSDRALPRPRRPPRPRRR